jgi:hypothetical protein
LVLEEEFREALTPHEAGRFASVAFGKLRKELRKRRDAGG